MVSLINNYWSLFSSPGISCYKDAINLLESTFGCINNCYDAKENVSNLCYPGRLNYNFIFRCHYAIYNRLFNKSCIWNKQGSVVRQRSHTDTSESHVQLLKLLLYVSKSMNQKLLGYSLIVDTFLEIVDQMKCFQFRVLILRYRATHKEAELIFVAQL